MTQKLKYPLIVSDFDGTLVRGDGKISEKNKAAIAKYTAAGGTFVLSTGRLPSGILSRAQELGLHGIVSCCQGSIIVDIDTKESILDGRLSLETTLIACKIMEALGLHIHAYDLWDYYSNIDDEPLRLYEKLTKTKATVVDNMPLSQFLAEKKMGAYKLLAMIYAEKSDELLRYLQSQNIPNCEITKSAEFLVEVVPNQYSKGTAVEFLANHYGVPLEKTIAIGDQLNDLSMIEKAGLGIAVKNADERLKEKANYISDYTCEEDAVAYIIDHFGLGE